MLAVYEVLKKNQYGQYLQDVLDGKATVSFTGILTEYKGAAQFTLIDLDGVKKADGTNWY